MKTLKMSLANIQGKMSRNEMRNIMAGSGGSSCCAYRTNWQTPGFTCVTGGGGASAAQFMATPNGWWACGTAEVKAVCC